MASPMTHAALKDLLPCPFCGGATRIQSNRDWHRLTGDHDETCMFVDTDAVMTVPATDECRLEMVAAWNRRAALSAMEGEAVVWVDPADVREQRHGLMGTADATQQQGTRYTMALYTSPPPQQADLITRALAYLGPHLELGTFAAPDWAIQLASILTGGDGCGTPIPHIPTPSPGPQGEQSGKWYCPVCDLTLFPKDVTFEETHDERADGCGNKVTPITHPAPSPGPQGGGDAWARAVIQNHLDFANASEADWSRAVAIVGGDAMMAMKPNRLLIEVAAARQSLDRIAAPPAHQPGEVGLDMIERAKAAAMAIQHNKEPWFPMTDRRLKAAIRAALAPKEAGHG